VVALAALPPRPRPTLATPPGRPARQTPAAPATPANRPTTAGQPSRTVLCQSDHPLRSAPHMTRRTTYTNEFPERFTIWAVDTTVWHP
jgi:hypothetical protein